MNQEIFVDSLSIDMSGEHYTLEMYLDLESEILQIGGVHGPPSYHEFSGGATFVWDDTKSQWIFDEGVRDGKYIWPSYWGEAEKDDILKLVQEGIPSPLYIKRKSALQKVADELVNKAVQVCFENEDLTGDDGKFDPDWAYDRSGEVRDPEEAVAWILIALARV